MVWKILRPHYWILDRKVRTTNRYLVVALILLLAFGGQWVFDNLIRDSLALLNSEQAVTAIASSLPSSLIWLLSMCGSPPAATVPASCYAGASRVSQTRQDRGRIRNIPLGAIS